MEDYSEEASRQGDFLLNGENSLLAEGRVGLDITGGGRGAQSDIKGGGFPVTEGRSLAEAGRAGQRQTGPGQSLVEKRLREARPTSGQGEGLCHLSGPLRPSPAPHIPSRFPQSCPHLRTVSFH